MHYSSILVTSRPGDVPACLRALETLPGVQVHLRYPERGRIIVTQETGSLAEQKDGLRRMQGLDPVLSADLVYHYVDAEREPGKPDPGEGRADFEDDREE